MSTRIRSREDVEVASLVDEGQKKQRIANSEGRTFSTLERLDPQKPCYLALLPFGVRNLIYSRLDLPDIIAYCLAGRATYLDASNDLVWRVFADQMGYIPRSGLPLYPQVMSYLKWLYKRADNFGPLYDYLAVPTIANACYITEVLKARDTLNVWEYLTGEFEIEEEDTAEDVIKKAKGFKKWCEEHSAELQDIDTLEIEGKELISLPDGLQHCRALHSIVLRDSKFIEFPQVLMEIPGRFDLDIRGNQITTYPEGWFQRALSLNSYMDDNPYWIPILEKICPIYLESDELPWQQVQAYVKSLEEIWQKKPMDWDMGEWDYSLEKIQYVERFARAHDTLVVWQALVNALPGKQSSGPEIDRLQSAEAIIGKAAEFSGWFKKNKKAISKVTELHLMGKEHKLTSLPKEVGEMTQLKTLFLAANAFMFVPEVIRNLTGLESLTMSTNKLKVIPAWIDRCTKLRVLNFNFNQLRSLPNELGNFPHLTHLFLGENQLQTIPASVFNYFGKLKEFRLDDNPLQELGKTVEAVMKK
jgi:hypothetical protein